ncbi:MAG TPA: TolC family protein [Gemmatimonadales bacterium]|nr:TolC family protein [Gemmatimonadales bacterium]
MRALTACVHLVVAAPLLVPRASMAQTGAQSDSAQSVTPTRVLALGEFLADVERSNPDYAAQQSAVRVADAQRRVARLFPNPVISFGYSEDITGQHLPATLSPGITQSILLGGKISARSAVADAAYEQALAQYGDVGRTLRAAAASAYVDALVAELAAERRRRSAEAVDRLAEANEVRFRAGDIGEADMLQSRVERQRFRADYLAAESNHQAALLALSLLMGKAGNDTVYLPAAYHEVPPRVFDVHSLIDSALARRPDVVAARRATDVALAGVRLAHAGRVTDLDLGLSFQHSSASTNAIAPSPTWQAAGLSLSFSLPLSSLVNHGELAAARYAVEQAKHAQASVEVRAENDVRQAYIRYVLAVDRIGLYSGTLLTDAERVLTARTYSYQRGAAPLSDVLIAQQAFNDVYVSYYDALGEYLKALIAVEQAAGFPTVDF